MAEYESIHGTRVRYLTSDPTLDSTTEGQVWYNSTTGTNKTLVQIKATLSSGSLSTARAGLAAGGSSPQTVGIVFGGTSAYPNTDTNATEEYNGFNWANGGNLNLARTYMAGFGTQTAAVGAGGYDHGNGDKSEVEEYNGSTWSEVTDLPGNQRSQGAAGTQTAGLVFGGDPAPIRTQSLEYDGTNWTSSGTLNTGRKYLAGCGIQTLALAVGGSVGTPVRSAATEEYNGSSWTSGNSFTEGRSALACFGVQTHAVIAGGADPSIVNSIEEYDGTNWTTSPATLATARRYTSGFGSGTAGVIAGGSKPAVANETEEYNSSINAITQSAWSSGGSASSSARNRALGGTQTAAFMSGGYNGANSQTRATEEYNGSSWTSGGDLSPQGNPDGGTYSGAACGTQTAGLFSGGSSQGSTDYYFNVSYEYDGSSWGSPATWTAPGLNGIQLFGTQTAAVNAGGSRPGQPLDRNYEYDGSSWTTGTTLPEGKRSGGQSGILTAGVIFGGSNPGLSPSSPSSTFHYDGTNWTAGGTMNFGSNGGQSATASSTDTISYQGSDGSSDTGRSQLYNGTAWAIDATAATVTSSLRSGAGTSGAALSAGGSPNAVQEYEGGTEVVTASTLTTS